MGKHSNDQAVTDNVPMSTIKVQWGTFNTEIVNTKYQIRIIQLSSSMDFIPSYSDMLNTNTVTWKERRFLYTVKVLHQVMSFGYKVNAGTFMCIKNI